MYIKNNLKLISAFFIVICWYFIAMAGARLPTLFKTLPMDFDWSEIVPAAFLACLVLLPAWRDVGLTAAPRALQVIVPPAIYICLLSGLTFIGRQPESADVVLLTINSLAIGMSEELLTRGILFRGLLTRLNVVPSIALSSAIFAGLHLLGLFKGGDPIAISQQVITAFILGVLMAALMLRTGTIWSAIVYHALWDFCAVGIEAHGLPMPPGLPLPNLLTYWLPTLFVLPLLLYALFLLRQMRHVR